MAKKTKAEEVESPADDPLAQIRAEVRKKWGDGVMVSASSILDEPQVVIPVSPMLDMKLSGGIPKGTWVSVCGPPKVGKTTTLLSFAAQCQRPEYGSCRVHYFNVEARLKRKNLLGIKGLDTSPDRFVIYGSSNSLVVSGKDHLEMAIHVLQTDPGCVVILDSVSALVESAVLEDGLGTQTRGGGAKLVSQFIDIVSSVVPVKKSIVLGVTHLIADTGGGGGKVEKAANRWLYQADVRLKAAWAEAWVVGGKKGKDGRTEGGREVGKIVHWTCQESALGPPGGKCDSRLRYGVGVDRDYELFELGRAAGLFGVSGNWYEFSFLGDLLAGGDLPKANGGEQAYSLLAAHPDWAGLLGEKVREFVAGDDGRAA